MRLEEIVIAEALVVIVDYDFQDCLTDRAIITVCISFLALLTPTFSYELT
jgi:hypothetical protein